MALGAITGVLGAVQGIGGLFGGGGPRQPRMSPCEKQQMMQQANPNFAMHQMMQKMNSMVNQMQGMMMGQRCGNPGGPCCQQGLHGMNNFGGPGVNINLGGNPMGNMFGGGQNININLGGGPQFGLPPVLGAQFNMGVNMFA